MKRCVRCLKPTLATQEHTLTYGESRYRLALCAKHGDDLDRDIFAWTRLGTLVEDHDGATFTPPVRTPEQIFSHVYVPPTSVAKRVVVAEEEPAPLLWMFTQHAVEQARERFIDLNVVLAVAQQPTTVTPGKTPDTRVHLRGDTAVVVIPELRCILTTYRTTKGAP